MAEIKTPLTEILSDDGNYSYLIEEDHTIKDVLRWALFQVGPEELLHQAQTVVEEETDHNV